MRGLALTGAKVTDTYRRGSFVRCCLVRRGFFLVHGARVGFVRGWVRCRLASAGARVAGTYLHLSFNLRCLLGSLLFCWPMARGPVAGAGKCVTYWSGVDWCAGGRHIYTYLPISSACVFCLLLHAAPAIFSFGPLVRDRDGAVCG